MATKLLSSASYVIKLKLKMSKLRIYGISPCFCSATNKSWKWKLLKFEFNYQTDALKIILWQFCSNQFNILPQVFSKLMIAHMTTSYHEILP